MKILFFRLLLLATLLVVASAWSKEGTYIDALFTGLHTANHNE